MPNVNFSAQVLCRLYTLEHIADLSVLPVPSIVGRIIIHHMVCLWSPVVQGPKYDIITLLNPASILLYKTQKSYQGGSEGIKFRFSKVP